MPDTIEKDLRKACSQPGCPVCRMSNHAVDLYLQDAFMGKKNNLAIRQDIRDGRGLCREHSWQLQAMGIGRTLGAALGYHDVLLTVIQHLSNVDLTPSQSKRFFVRKNKVSHPDHHWAAILKPLFPGQKCPACRLMDQYTNSVIDTLVNTLNESGMESVLASSDFLCIPHFRQTLERIRDEASWKSLTAIGVEKYEEARKQLVEIIRRIETEKLVKRSDEDVEAWHRVLGFVNGEK